MVEKTRRKTDAHKANIQRVTASSSLCLVLLFLWFSRRSLDIYVCIYTCVYMYATLPFHPSQYHMIQSVLVLTLVKNAVGL